MAIITMVSIRGARVQENTIEGRTCEHGCQQPIDVGQWYVRVLRKDWRIEMFDIDCFEEEFGVRVTDDDILEEFAERAERGKHWQDVIREIMHGRVPEGMSPELAKRAKERAEVSAAKLKERRAKQTARDLQDYREGLKQGGLTTWNPTSRRS